MATVPKARNTSQIHLKKYAETQDIVSVSHLLLMWLLLYIQMQV